MKLFFAFALIASALSFQACSTEEENEETPTGRLLIKVLDADGSAAADAQVTLYTSQTDYNEKSNAFANMQSDQFGEAMFNDLEVQAYWYHVEKQGRTNSSSSFNTGSAIKANELTEKITQLR